MHRGTKEVVSERVEHNRKRTGLRLECLGSDLSFAIYWVTLGNFIRKLHCFSFLMCKMGIVTLSTSSS